MTRSSKNWSVLPGGWNALNDKRQLFERSNALGFPDIFPTDLAISKHRELISYNHRDDKGINQARKICHFFLDDYRFESVWNRPTAALTKVRKFWATLTPDFSVYTNYPIAMQFWNTYRSRWIGRFWQENGVNVIPTVNWSDSQSLTWCFWGLPKKSILTIAVPDIRRPEVFHNFRRGFFSMVNQLDPRVIIVYGKLPFKCSLAIEHLPDWTQVKAKTDIKPLIQIA